MKSVIKIAKDISFPLDVVTQTIAILAKRRAGKSYTMRRIVEQLCHAKQQVVIVDPKGDQWGIRASADGKASGFPVIILGGEHADVPLEANSGEIVAKLVVEEGVSILLDLSLFRKSEVAVFMTGFLENLYRLKAREIYRTPVMLVIDEADAVAPQKPQRGEERMLGAAEDIVRRGGQRGIGCVLVTQRSAVLNKNVLTQAQVLIALRTIAPQDLAAMNAWIDVHGTQEQRKTLMESLPSLPTGDAWFWSPGWPTDEGIFKRVHVLPIETFDSGATPKPGEVRHEPKTMADVDIEALKRQMSAVIEKAKADYPAALRRRIVELEKHKCPVVTQNPVKIERIEIPAVGKRALEGLKLAESNMRKLAKAIKESAASVDASVSKLSAELAKISASRPNGTYREFGTFVGGGSTPKGTVIATGRVTKPAPPREEGDEALTGPEQRVLDALAWCESIGNQKPPNELLAFLSGYSHFRSTGYTNPRGYLKTKGLIEYSAGSVYLTEAGRALAVIPESPLTQEALQRVVLEKLDGPERKLLTPLLEKYPEGISNTDLCAMAGYMHERSTGYTNPRGRLKSFGLIEYLPGGMVVAEKILFLP